MSFAKLLIGWGLSIMIYAGLVQGWFAASGKPSSSFFEASLGLGILLAIPGFLFALVVGWPTMSWLASKQLTWLTPLAAALALPLIMWILTSLMLPAGWNGAGHSLVGYAAVLGLVWGSLNLATDQSG